MKLAADRIVRGAAAMTAAWLLALPLAAEAVRLLAEGKYAEAEREARQELARLAVTDAAYAVALHNLATALSFEGRYGEAEPLFGQAIARGERAMATNPSDLAAMYNGLGVLLYQQGRYERAEPVFRQALARMRAVSGPQDPQLASCVHNLGTLYAEAGQNAKAEEHLRAALAIWEFLDHPNRVSAWNSLAFVYLRQGRLERAESLIERSAELAERVLPPGHADRALILRNRALAAEARGQYEQAGAALEQALALQEAALSPHHPALGRTLAHYADVLRKLRQAARARKMDARAKAILAR